MVIVSALIKCLLLAHGLVKTIIFMAFMNILHVIKVMVINKGIGLRPSTYPDVTLMEERSALRESCLPLVRYSLYSSNKISKDTISF